jgi:cytochrome b561
VSLKHHSPVIRVMHWSIAGLVIAMLAMSAFIMSKIPDADPEKLAAAGRHMAAGLLVILFFGIRLHMRHRVGRPPALSSGMAWADWLAGIVHKLLDLLVAAMIISGVGMALLSHLPMRILTGGQFPAEIKTMFFHGMHVVGAWSIAALLVMHIGGAFFHQLILRDGLIWRMFISPREVFSAFARWREHGMPLAPRSNNNEI